MIDRRIEREVNQLLVHCDKHYQEKGCDWKGELGKLENHQKECGYIAVDCSLQCGERFQRRLLKEHEEDLCRNQVKSLKIKLAEALAKIVALEAEIKAIKAKNARKIEPQDHKIVQRKKVEPREASAQQTMEPEPFRRCPVCNTKFPLRMKQQDFENHVEGHFQR